MMCSFRGGVSALILDVERDPVEIDIGGGKASAMSAARHSLGK